MIKDIKKVIKKIIPDFLISLIWKLRSKKKRWEFKKALYRKQKLQSKAIRKITPQKITCLFLVTFQQTWKYDYVYKEMQEDSRFNPIILICPIVNYGKDNMISRMEDSASYFRSKGYNVLCAYNKETNEYFDIRKDIKPDILFYTNPYQGLIDDRYYIDSFLDTLTVYVPYAINNNSDFQYTYNLPFHNLLWRHYIESEVHLEYVKSHTFCKGNNAKCVGYPGIEGLIRNSNPSSTDWKMKDTLHKRIIWAPHHTIENKGSVVYSCFLKYYDYIISLAETYQDEVQFVFKPHPILRNKLDLLWGKERTDAYYSKWENMPNTKFHDGDYEDLFLTSDAMIHDSGSFIAEYLYVNKPVMRTMSEVPPEEMYNDFALNCLEQYYKAYNEADIELFIQNVINGIDPLKEQRTKFINEVLMPNGSPSQNIINDIIDSIEHQRV